VRDADPDDFSLEALIAHECGHQAVFRNAAWQQVLPERMTSAAEEVLASVIGSVLVDDRADREDLMLKSIDDALQCGLDLTDACNLVFELRRLLEKTQ
jgi:hypothetical protein